MLSVVLMSRATAKNVVDMTPITHSPLRTVGWFMIGATVASMVNVRNMNRN